MTDTQEHSGISITVNESSVIEPSTNNVIQGVAALAVSSENAPDACTASVVGAPRSVTRNRGRNGTGLVGIQKYLYDIGETPLLTADEEKQLARTIALGRDASERLNDWRMTYEQASTQVQQEIDAAVVARDHFMRANLRLVVSIAKRYPESVGADFQDIIQAGNAGLEKAIDKFDPEKGFKFSTYATAWIIQYIQTLIYSESKLIKVPRNKGFAISRSLRQVEGDISKLDKADDYLYKILNPSSLNSPVGDDGESEMHEFIAADGAGTEETAVDNVIIKEVLELLSTIGEREKIAVTMRFGIGGDKTHSYGEIGKALGVSSGTAATLTKSGLAEIRRNLDSIKPKDT